MATAIVIGSVIGSGIFKKPHNVAANVDCFSLTMLVWMLGGVLALLGSLTVAELAVLFPEAGGSYVYLRESYGPLAAFLFGWVEFWIIQSAGAAALATVFTEELNNILGNPGFQQAIGAHWGPAPFSFWGRQALAVALILLMGWVNVRGVLWGGWLQTIVTAVKVATLLGILLLPLVALGMSSPEVAKPQVRYLQPFWPASWEQLNLAGFGTALVGVLWAYNGWMNVSMIAGEVRQPRRNLPLALLAGVGVIIFLYLGANLAYSLILPRQDMAGLEDVSVLTAFSGRLLGPAGAVVASAALMASVFGAFNGCLLTTPRIVFKMGEDALAPAALGEVHRRHHTPAVAIWLFAAWTGLLVLGAAALTRFPLPVVRLGAVHVDLTLPPDKSPFDVLTEFAIFGVVLFETLAVSSIFSFRRRLPHVERPYRCLGYPWVPMVYIGIMAIVAGHMFLNHRVESLVGVAFILVGALVHAYWRFRATGQRRPSGGKPGPEPAVATPHAPHRISAPESLERSP
jgi:amino acid transporter